MVRNNLCVRTATWIVQKTAANLVAVKRDYSHRVNLFNFSSICNPRYFVNMDETNVYFNCKPKRSVSLTGQKTIYIRLGSSSSLRVTVCVSIAFDGNKLSSFLMFKRASRGPVERSLHEILSEGIFGCAQRKVLMNDRRMQDWFQKIRKS